MKLIKITEGHYVVVDDTKIKEGDIWYNASTSLWWKVTADNVAMYNQPSNMDRNGLNKITHSTQPIEKDEETYTYEKVKYIPLSYIKELIGEVDVEKKAREEILYNDSKRDWWKQGYKQALEDNKDKKYTEEDMRECWIASERFDRPYSEGYAPNFEEFIQSFQPKTEWEVEIVDDKLKIK